MNPVPSRASGRARFLARLPVLATRLALFALFVFAAAAAHPAHAQHPGTGTNAPPPPPGNGELTVQILHPADPGQAAGIDLALYALSPDGTPGFVGGKTDAEGRYTFRGISTDPGIVYLIGARFHEIPFGERTTFAAGQSEARVEIEVSEPTERVDGVDVEELRVRVDWMGDRLVFQEVLRLSNASGRVIRLPTDDPDRSIVVRPLGPDVRDFSAAGRSISDGLVLEDGRVRFQGPLYPGEQRVEYQYTRRIPEDTRTLRFPIELESPAKRVVVVAGTSGLEISGPGFVASNDLQADGGRKLEAWARAGLAAGEVVEVEVHLPESRLDASLLKIPRTDVWLELDDTRLAATVDIQVEVEPGAPVAGTPDAPLLQVTIPDGATLQGVAPEAEALGLVPRDDGGFDVIGPIGAGKTSLGYSFRMPADPEGVRLGLRFPRDVEVLNVLIADTGLALDSHRLHRRRPFRSGTRNYLHREAFNVGPDETVDLELVPLRDEGISRNTAIGLTILAAAAGAFFLFAPLRSLSRREAEQDVPRKEIQAQREAIYAEIRDLDHDHETGKLDPEDYERMRAALRARAITLLRQERDGATTAAEPAPQGPEQTSPAPPRPSADQAPASATGPHTGGFCPSCGGRVASEWRFCSHCGGPLNPARTTHGSSEGPGGRADTGHPAADDSVASRADPPARPAEETDG